MHTQVEKKENYEIMVTLRAKIDELRKANDAEYQVGVTRRRGWWWWPALCACGGGGQGKGREIGGMGERDAECGAWDPGVASASQSRTAALPVRGRCCAAWHR